MDIKEFIQDWIDKSNTYDTENYLKKWHKDAVLDDPSVGKIFKGHSGIKQYFESYFLDYSTQTRLVKMEIISDHEVHLEVEFTGEFPEGKIGGIFEFILKDGKIDRAVADLL